MSDELVYIGSIPDAVSVTDVGLEFRKDIEYDQWLTLMATLQQLSTAFQFAIGDALQLRTEEIWREVCASYGCNWVCLSKSR